MTTAAKPHRIKIMKSQIDSDYNIKAGKYWVGDPCYIYPDKQWQELCRNILNEDQIVYEGFFIGSTAYGDGGYPIFCKNVQMGRLGVDAGLLSVIPLSIAQKWPEWKKRKHLGVEITVTADSVIEYSNGNFEFGDFRVITSDDNEVSEDDEDR